MALMHFFPFEMKFLLDIISPRWLVIREVGFAPLHLFRPNERHLTMNNELRFLVEQDRIFTTPDKKGINMTSTATAVSGFCASPQT